MAPIFLGGGGGGLGGSAFMFGITAARSDKRRTVRVWFNEPPLCINPAALHDARNPANWTVVPVPPAGEDLLAYVAVNIESVQPVAEIPEAVDVIVDHDFTFGVQYQVAVNTTVQSVMGWPVDGPVSAIVDAYEPPWRNPLAKTQVYNWLGSGVVALDEARDFERMAAVIQECMEQLKTDIETMQTLFDPLYCPDHWLDAWLESRGNPFWDVSAEMNAVAKRRLLLQLVAIYKAKGTAAGIKSAIELLLGISCWVDPFNESCWLLDTDDLGGEAFDPTHPATYPVVPVDPNWPPYEPYSGGCSMGPGDPVCIHDLLGPDDGSTHFAELSTGWALGQASDGQFLHDPADGIGIAPLAEPERRGRYNYRISVSRVLTAQELVQVRAVAKYMQPSYAHLLEIKEPPTGYDPVWLDVSLLDEDWYLH